MYDINVVLEFSTSLLAVTSGVLNVDTDRSFLFAVADDYETWKTVLDIIIFIDMLLERGHIPKLKHKLNPDAAIDEVVDPQHMRSCEESQVHAMTTNNDEGTETEGTLPTNLIITNAWYVVRYMVLISHAESADSAALKFGEAVFATAIRCQVLWIFKFMIEVLYTLEYSEDMKQ